MQKPFIPIQPFSWQLWKTFFYNVHTFDTSNFTSDYSYDYLAGWTYNKYTAAYIRYKEFIIKQSIKI